MGWILTTEIAQKCEHGKRIYTLDAHSTEMILADIDNAPIKTLDSGYEKYCQWMATKTTEPVQLLADLLLSSHRTANLSDDEVAVQHHQSQLTELVERAKQLPPTARARLIDKLSGNDDLTKLVAP